MWLFVPKHRNSLSVGLCASIALCLSMHPAYSAWKYIRPLLRGRIASSPLLLYQGLKPRVYAYEENRDRFIKDICRLSGPHESMVSVRIKDKAFFAGKIDLSPFPSFARENIQDVDGLNAHLKTLIDGISAQARMERDFYQEVAEAIIASQRLTPWMRASAEGMEIVYKPCLCSAIPVQIELHEKLCECHHRVEFEGESEWILNFRIFLKKGARMQASPLSPVSVYNVIYCLVHEMGHQFRCDALLSKSLRLEDRVSQERMADRIAACVLSNEDYIASFVSFFVDSCYQFSQNVASAKEWFALQDARNKNHPPIRERIGYHLDWWEELLCFKGMDPIKARQKVAASYRALVVSNGIRARLHHDASSKLHAKRIVDMQSQLIDIAGSRDRVFACSRSKL